MEVAAGEAEAATAAVALARPRDMLREASARTDMGVVAVWTILALQGRGRRDGREERGHSLHVRTKAHVVVPLVIDGEGLDAARDWMIWQGLELGRPVRVDGPPGLEVTARPLEHVVAWLTLGHLDRVVDADQSDALVHQGIYLGEVSVDRMAAAAVHVQDDRVGVVEGRGVLRPTPVVYGRHDLGHVGVEPLRQEHATGSVFVGAEAVALATGDQDDLLLAVG